MKRTRHRLRGGRAIVACVLALVGISSFGWWVLSGESPGCTPLDNRLASTLTHLDVLSLRPPGATESDTRYAGCDQDDVFAYAGQRYESTAGRHRVVDYYREAVVRAGWTLKAENDDVTPSTGLVLSPAVLCFTKVVADGVMGYLTISFPGDLGARTHAFGIEVMASRHGTNYC